MWSIVKFCDRWRYFDICRIMLRGILHLISRYKVNARKMYQMAEQTSQLSRLCRTKEPRA